MSTATDRLATVRAAARRGALRRWCTLGVVALCTLACGAMLTVLGGRFSRRFDVTATGEHRLAPRTLRVLDRLNGPYKAVICADLRAGDPASVRTLRDTLQEFQARTPNFTAEIIDVRSASGAAQFAGLLAGIAKQDEQQIASQASAVSAALTQCRQSTDALRGVDAALTRALTPALPVEKRQAIENIAAGARLVANDLADAAQSADLGLNDSQAAVRRPDIAAKALAAKAKQACAGLDAVIGESLALLKDDKLDGVVRAALQDAATRAQAVRASLTREAQGLRTLPVLGVYRLADALESSSGAVMLAPPGVGAQPGVVAMDLPSLVPPAGLTTKNADTKTRVEEILSTSLATLLAPKRPILVLMHAENEQVFARARFFDAMRGRLQARGMDVVEWPVLRAPTPDLAALGDTTDRPVVFASLTPNTLAPSDASARVASGTERAATLAGVLGKLADEGKPLLVSLGPAMAATFGDQDPIADVLGRFGLSAKTGAPLIAVRTTARGPTFSTDMIVRAPAGEHVLQKAMVDLATFVTWPLPIAPLPETRATLAPLLVAAPSADTWGESQWIRLRQVPREQRGLLADPPTPNEGDLLTPPAWPGQNPAWVAAAAAEIPGDRPRRLVVVSSVDWFIDPVVEEAYAIDGREVPAHPGNLELLESAVLWLAGQDDLIAQSATARAAPTVSALQAGSLRRLRLMTIFGPTGLVLLAGVAYALWRK